MATAGTAKAEDEPRNPENPPEKKVDTRKAGTASLMLGGLGVVFGDIGTSPIYAFREALHAATDAAPASREAVIGVLSLIVWALILIVTIKYVAFVLRADNKGEGGTLSLMSLARRRTGPGAGAVFVVGMLGAALFFGDAIITPAISVLSAVEGLEVVTPAFDPYVVVITLAILVVLFWSQRLGTEGVARIFGPVMGLWFLALGAVGAWHIKDDPGILAAINPYHAVQFLIIDHAVAFVTIGAVFLAVTGAEALYADLGHFGRKPIVAGWLAIVFPSLLLCYFGQGAYVLSHEGRADNPFFQMQPDWFLVPMVALATAATVIASQAVISGAYSMTKQAVQLNILPRMEILHTSETQEGQIFMPRINWLLGTGVIVLVVGFQSSAALASAYGISVTGEMLVTVVLLFVVMRRVWRWSMVGAAAFCGFFLVIDAGFFLSNAVKIVDGGWVSLCAAAMIMLLMATWTRGSRLLFDKTRKSETPIAFLAANLSEKPPHTVPGTAVFLTGDPESAPTALLHSLKHYHVLHEHNVILSIVTADQPVVPPSERAHIEKLSPFFTRVTLTFGYMEQPNVPRGLAICRKKGWTFDIMNTSFFLSRRSLKIADNIGMPRWQAKLFIFMARTASDATEYFRIPTGRVVEIGTQVVV